MIQIRLNKVEIAFIAVVVLTLLNGFYNSLLFAYGFTSYPFATFLFDPADLHADLIKTSLSFCREQIKYYQSWPVIYQEYYLHNPYAGIDGLNNGQLSNLSAPPLTTFLALFFSSILSNTSPTFLVTSMYIIVITCLFLLSLFFYNKKISGTIFLFVTMLLSYPMLFILTRGHIFSFINVVFLISFFYNIMSKNNFLIAVILLSVVVNFRPNAAFLSVLFMIYGLKDGLKSYLYFCLFSLSIFFILLLSTHSLYPDYTFTNFIKAVGIYFNMYVLGGGGDAFNNSMLGLIKLSIGTFFIDKIMFYEIIKVANTIVFLFSCSLAVLSMYLYYKEKINRFEFIFLIACLYALSSSVFTVYYMFMFFSFLLLVLKFEDTKQSKFFNIIMIVSVLMLVPKNYIFTDGLSLEVIINPLIMMVAVLCILVKSSGFNFKFEQKERLNS